MDRLYEHAGQTRPGFFVTVTTGVPIARGLGSSSTAIIAGLVFANGVLGNSYDPQVLLKIAVEMEGHPNNVAPALLGGVVLYDTRPYRLPWPTEWRILTLSPDYPVLTEEARRILPASVPLRDAMFNLRKAAVLTVALLSEDADALRAGLADRLHQPYRRRFIRDYDEIESRVMEAGAFGMIISGSGSTMAVFYPAARRDALLSVVETTLIRPDRILTVRDLTVDPSGATMSACPENIPDLDIALLS